jgi:peptidoglycan/xylan/chitin deacetylase (PgdA/CDA1 family)
MRATLSFLVLIFAAMPIAAHAQTRCEGALGTSRVLAVDAAATPRVGRKSFPQTLPLKANELVLTFDDGPWPGTTPHVLEALKRECVQATFFLLGRNAVANPELARRERAEGHTIGYHTYSHPLLNHMRLPAAEAEIDRGFAAIDTVLYGKPLPQPKTPFFRFPGFASSPPLLDDLQRRGIVVFGADLWASDWNPMSPRQEQALLLSRVKASQGGILLLHDTKRETAEMLPQFLRALKGGGYQIVHVVPADHVLAPAASH